MKNLLCGPGEDAAVALIDAQCRYAVEVEVLRTSPFLDRGHWIESGWFADELRLWDDANTVPLRQLLAAEAEGQSNLDVPPPPRQARPLANPPGRNWCPFNVTLIALAATWHVLGPGLRRHGPATRTLLGIMGMMFDTTAPAGTAVGTQAGELHKLASFTDMFFLMRPQHARGDQLPMCEVWGWLVGALRTENYAWRNVAFYRSFAAAEPAGFTFEDLCRPQARGGKAGDYDWLEAHHG
eukprot:gene2788-9078_t